jgi:NAD(P)-dependent dehydrogenase (short-subunit alcohol dehydrogenase family)
MMSFEGLHVVVTGGTGNLGAAVCARLLDQGAQVHVPAFEDEVPGHFLLDSHSRLRVTTGVDLRDEAAVNAWFATLPGLWASIHCAGGFAWRVAAESDGALLDSMLGINLTTTYLCSLAAVRRFAEDDSEGRIVNVASRQALESRLGVGTVAYTASKAAVAAFSTALGQEVVGRGVLVSAVAPSVLATDANREAMPDEDHDMWATLDEVADVIAFLASPANRIARGVIPVYGRS